MKSIRSLVFLIIAGMLSCKNKKEDDHIPVVKSQGVSNTEKSTNAADSLTAASSKEDKMNVPPDESLSVDDKIAYYKNQENFSKAFYLVDSMIQKDPSNERWWSTKAMLHYENDEIGRAHV